MSIHHLTTPISSDDICNINAGDLVFLTGTLVTARDDVHLRVVKQHNPLPVDLYNGVIFMPVLSWQNFRSNRGASK